MDRDFGLGSALEDADFRRSAFRPPVVRRVPSGRSRRCALQPHTSPHGKRTTAHFRAGEKTGAVERPVLLPLWGNPRCAGIRPGMLRFASVAVAHVTPGGGAATHQRERAFAKSVRYLALSGGIPASARPVRLEPPDGTGPAILREFVPVSFVTFRFLVDRPSRHSVNLSSRLADLPPGTQSNRLRLGSVTGCLLQCSPQSPDVHAPGAGCNCRLSPPGRPAGGRLPRCSGF